MFAMMMPMYILAFCRVVTGLVFLVSSISKLLNIAQFRQAINNARLLPEWLVGIAALLFLGGEFTVVLFMVIGGTFLAFGFAFAIFLLFLFSSVLTSILVRKIRTSCNCFGPSTRQVSRLDVWRNVGFITVALLGCAFLNGLDRGQEQLNLTEWGLIGLGGAIFVAFWLHLAEIVQVLRLEQVREESYKE